MIRTYPKLASLTLLGLICVVSAPVVAALTPTLIKSPGSLNWIDGEWAVAYEKQFDENLAIRDFAVAGWASLSYVLFHEGRDGVLVGGNDWLFTNEEFKFFPDAIGDEERTLDIIKAVKTRLEHSSVKLLVAIVPDKSRIYLEHLGRYERPPYVADRLDRFLSALEDTGIQSPHLQTSLEAAKETADVFLRTDTHWTPFGADAAAKVIAEAAAPLITGQPRRDFATTETETIEQKGDLLKFIPMGVLSSLGPKPDLVTQRTTAATGTLGLFDSVAVPVTLVGTSYSANPLWNFSGALAEHLRADVANAAEEGKGPMVPMMDYLAGKDFAEAPPSLVIWEIPERFIAVDYNVTLPNEE